MQMIILLCEDKTKLMLPNVNNKTNFSCLISLFEYLCLNHQSLKYKPSDYEKTFTCLVYLLRNFQLRPKCA